MRFGPPVDRVAIRRACEAWERGTPLGARDVYGHSDAHLLLLLWLDIPPLDGSEMGRR